jgi:hypothetical protein
VCNTLNFPSTPSREKRDTMRFCFSDSAIAKKMLRDSPEPLHLADTLGEL